MMRWICPFGLGHLAVVAAVAVFPWQAQAQQQSPPQPAPLLHPNNTALPPGPFASWPEDAREPALSGVRSRCGFMTAMAFANYQGPKEAISPIITAVLSACIAKVMPDDWPGKAAEIQQSADAYEAAKRLDPKAPDPNLLAGGIAHALANPH
jgi:hypothetical protein